jgi:hypothetical protein
VDLQEVEFLDMDGIDVTQDRETWWALVNALMNLWVLYSAEIFMAS